MQFIYYNPFEYFLLISIKAKVSLIPTHPSPSIKPILVDTFVELLDEKVNKLKDINVIKIVIDDKIDDIPESDEDIIED